MPITEDAKDLLRERLKLARQAKLDKKNKVTEALNKPVETVSTSGKALPTAENEKEVVQPAPVEEVRMDIPQVASLTKPSVAINQPIDSVAILPKASKAKVTSKDISPKVTKAKYAKLVFYQEPTNKKMKKLTKLMDNSSDSEDNDFHYKPAPVQETSSQQLQYNKISQLSRMIFD